MPTTVTYKDMINNGGYTLQTLHDLFARMRLGDMLEGVVDQGITQSASPVINLRTLAKPPVGAGGGKVLAVTGALSTIAPAIFDIAGTPSVASTDPTTVAGADGDGGIVWTPVTQPRDARPPRFAQIVMPDYTVSRAIHVFDNEVWLIVAGTDGTVDNSETASAIVTALRANAAASRLYSWAATGTGASKVLGSTLTTAPKSGHVTAGPPIKRSPGIAARSADGYGLLLPANLTGANLTYQPGPAIYLGAGYVGPQPR